MGNRNGKCSNDGLGNGISNSNGASFPDGDFPKLVASKIDVDNNSLETSHLKLRDHEQLIDTFHELRQSFPLQLKVQRRRERREHGVRFEIPEINVSNSSLTRITHIENRDHVYEGPEVDMSSIDQTFDVSSPLRSVFPISFDCLYSQVDISVDVAGTVDETEGSHDVGSFVGQSVEVF